ncbi:MAG: hypothetical protein ABIE94_00015 [archaeon]
MVKCRFCEYDWISRVEAPKACPRCKNRLDYPRKNDFYVSEDSVEEER